MDVKQAEKHPTEFNTLSEIMEYFHSVPFDDFRKNINEWFIKQLKKKRPDLMCEQSGFDLNKLLQFTEQTFTTADEMQQAKCN